MTPRTIWPDSGEGALRAAYLDARDHGYELRVQGRDADHATRLGVWAVNDGCVCVIDGNGGGWSTVTITRPDWSDEDTTVVLHIDGPRATLTTLDRLSPAARGVILVVREVAA
jgi:hypothetical protein